MIRFRRGRSTSDPSDGKTSDEKSAEQHEKFLDDLAKSLLIQEHSSLRGEILASYGYAQSIVRWTLATFAAFVAAGLVAVYNASTRDSELLFAAALIIFGIGIPGIVWLNSWTWLGELYRAERAGSFLRRVETDLTDVEGLRERLGFAPLRWENFIWSNRTSKTLWGKQTLTYFGTAGVFFGSAAGSAIIFASLWWQRVVDGPTAMWPVGATYLAFAVAINLFGLTGCLVIYKRLSKLGDAVAPKS